jgi:phosphoribosylformylglycinamidine synthase II
MVYRIEVSTKQTLPDPTGEGLTKDARHLGITAVRSIRHVRVFLLKAPHLSRDMLHRIAREILADPVADTYRLSGHIRHGTTGKTSFVEIAYLPGVMDPVALTAHALMQKIGISHIEEVRTRNRYEISGTLSKNQIAFLVKKLLMNRLIQVWQKDEKEIATQVFSPGEKKRTVPLAHCTEEELLAISRNGLLSLNSQEMKKIQNYFLRKARNPSDVELETIAQTWSEHCVHKTFRGLIFYNGEVINDLLTSTIAKATKVLKKPFCISVFKDNAGIIKFDSTYGITFKVETHNHPSALEPYGGAGTGIGGVIRDTMGTGLGAKPIANTDIFCFGNLSFRMKDLPATVLHPMRIFKGVISGVRDYGNRMGIPTVNGAILFDNGYVYNPIVYCGSLGFIPIEYAFKEPKANDAIIVCGGKTGKDGIHGVTFASKELDESSEVSSSGAVQIGNPITEKKLLDALLEARDKRLYNAITDCGGGGLSSAVGEMGKDLGATVHLDRVPLKYEGLRYDEIWISESQERMIISVPQKKVNRIRKIFKKHDVDYAIIGRFERTGKLQLHYRTQKVGDLDMDFLHKGYPQSTKRATWSRNHFAEPKLPKSPQLASTMLKLLSHPNIASKEVVVRQYDHEVQAMSGLKPLTGTAHDGPSDGAILRPFADNKRGIVVSNGINPYYGKIDPYWMAAAAIEESLRNAAACGGNPQRAAILDNFSWGDVSNPKILGQLVRACLGCRDTSIALGVPFISGKDSLNNTFSLRGKKRSILSTLLISCVSICDDVSKSTSTDLKENGNPLYMVGITKRELGGSHYYKLFNRIGNTVPELDFSQSRETLKGIHRAISQGCVAAIHDCSEGGIGIALAEMSIGGELGMMIDINAIPGSTGLRLDELLFSESNSRFIVEVWSYKRGAFEKAMRTIPYAQIGTVDGAGELILTKGKRTLMRLSVRKMKRYWKKRIGW